MTTVRATPRTTGGARRPRTYLVVAGQYGGDMSTATPTGGCDNAAWETLRIGIDPRARWWSILVTDQPVDRSALESCSAGEIAGVYRRRRDAVAMLEHLCEP